MIRTASGNCVREATVLVLLVLLAGVASLLAQQSRCVGCHLASLGSKPDQPGRASDTHVRDWETSAHSQAGVGCNRCHGGDPTSFEARVAHRSILRWRNPDSPVHRANIPATCGTCHAGPFVAFQKSRHYALLRGGNPVVPTCTTCHGNAGENRPSPAALERECATCHRPGPNSDHPEFPALGRAMLEGVRESRAILGEARALIRRIRDGDRRTQMEEAARQVDVPLTEAVQSAHAFVYDDLRERLATAQRRLAALFEELANPPLRP